MAANDWTTLTNVKALLGISDTSQDTVLSLMISGVSGFLSRMMGTDVVRATYNETYPGSDRQYLVLNNFPIQSITSISDNGAPLTQDVDFFLSPKDAAKGFIFRPEGWRSIAWVGGLALDVYGKDRTLNVVSVCGWYMPNDPSYSAGAIDSLPVDLTFAATEMVVEKFLMMQRMGYGLKSYSEGGISMSFMDVFGERQKEVINQWRRWL